MNLSAWGLFAGLVPIAFAASQSLVVTAVPATLDQSSSAEIRVDFTCPSCSTDSYLRAVLYSSGTLYFGYTRVPDGTWVNAPGSQCSSYYPVLQSDLSPEGSWSGTISIKPDPDSSYYYGPGEYHIKVGRYTPSCGSVSVWSEPVAISLTGPTPTPTHSPTSKPLPTSINTSVPKATPVPTETTTKQPVPIAGTPLHVSRPLIPDILGNTDAPVVTESAVKHSEMKATAAAYQGTAMRAGIIPLILAGIGTGIISVALAAGKTELWKQLIIQKEREKRDGY